MSSVFYFVEISYNHMLYCAIQKNVQYKYYFFGNFQEISVFITILS
jgi:hypothetical protein